LIIKSQAVIHENPEIINSLLLVKADVNQADTLGCSPLHYALLTKNMGIFTDLFKAGANLDVVDLVLTYSCNFTAKTNILSLGNRFCNMQSIFPYQQSHPF
jgi:ankyrin repeat protein